MTNPPLILKIAAVASSLALAGGYIWFEAGKRAPRAAASTRQAQQMPESDTTHPLLPGSKSYDGMGRNTFVVGQKDSADGYKESYEATPGDIALIDRSFLSGSKSGSGISVPQEPKAGYVFQAKPLPAASTEYRSMLPGSKSDAHLFHDESQIKATERSSDGAPTGYVAPRVPTSDDRMLLSGSKAAFPGFENGPDKKSSVAPAEPTIIHQKVKLVELSDEDARLLFSSSKSGAVFTPPPATKPEAPAAQNSGMPAESKGKNDPVLDSGLITVEDILQLSRSLFPVTKPDFSNLHVLPEDQRPVKKAPPPNNEGKPLIDHKKLDSILSPSAK